MSQIIAVTFEDLESMEVALDTAHTNIVAAVAQGRTDVNAMIAGWAEDTPSRQAQISYDGRLAQAITALTTQLQQVRTELARVKQAAHDAEVRNVAIMD